MDWPPISKSPADLPVQPNLVDYDKARAGFSWEAIRKELGGLPNGGLNIAHEAVDRHAAGPRRDHLALRWLGADGATRDFTYRDLAEGSSRFANVLRELGTGKGDRVFALAGRIPELYITALGALKNRSVFCPFFSAFGPEPPFTSAYRRGSVPVTTLQLYQKKVAWLRDFRCLIGACVAFSAEAAMRTHPQMSHGGCTSGLPRRRENTPSPQPIRKTRPCCISPAAPPARPRGRSMSTRQS